LLSPDLYERRGKLHEVDIGWRSDGGSWSHDGAAPDGSAV